MNWYKENKNEWKNIIEVVSSEIKRTHLMIEKDIIQSMFLYELSKSEIPFVFKGGTSLSKAYQVIDRFSEDIDLSLPVKPTDREKKKSKEIILGIAEKLGFILDNEEEIKSRYDYNKYVFKYESLFTEIKPEIIVETSYYQKVYPVVKHNIYTHVGLFCEQKQIEFPIPFDAMNFEMNVQSMERTFIDKVFAICDYRIQNMFERDSRHLYDVAKIFPLIEINEKFISLIREVRCDRSHSRNNPSAQSKYDINMMLDEIIQNRFFELDYNNLTQKLLYEEMNYDEAIKNGISKIANLKIF